ncbi:uncharacterized protein LOC144557509 [Carex rostrata]
MDWAELNSDLLHLIVKKLGDISNFIRFRVVCKKWRLAAPTSDPPPQLPWFLGCHHDPKIKPYRLFYSLYSNKTQYLHLPQVQAGNVLIGSASKYVHISDHQLCEYDDPYRHLKLLDPLTGSQIPIPFTGSKVPIPSEEEKTAFWRQYIGLSHSCNPNSTLNAPKTKAVIAAFAGRHPSRYYYNVTLMLLDDRKEKTFRLTKHILYRSIVIYEIVKEVTKLLDVTTRDGVQVFSKPGFSFSHLLEACGDVLGVVTLFKSFVDTSMDEALFEVYRLEDDGGKPCWAKMNDGIGDRMLFLDWSGSGFGLSASHFAGFKGNCIYFQESNNKFGSDSRIFLARFDIEKSTTQLLPGEFYGVWFVPHL